MSTDSAPPEFISVINNFITNVKNTFPEYLAIINKWCVNMDTLWVFCKKKYPPRRSDILSKNVDMFEDVSDVDTEFLPHIHFKNLWQYEGISDTTKDAIWGYLKLTLLSVGTEDIDLDEAFNQVQELFKSTGEDPTPIPIHIGSSDVCDPDPSPPSSNPLDGMFGGVLGDIAKDLAEDMMASPDFSLDGVSNIEDAMKQIFSNPSKMTNLFKSVSEKLDHKMSSGELSNTDIMRETTMLMSKIKDVPGMAEGFGGLFGDGLHSGSGGGGGSGRPMTKQEKIKERLRKKIKK
jgi:hypothetical protein